MKKNMVLWSNLMLVGAAFIWGSQVVFQKIATVSIGPASFYGMRCIMGVFTLSFIALIMGIAKRKNEEKLGIEHTKKGKDYYRRLFILAPLCVTSNVFGNILVQWGLFYTAASKAAFLNSIYIIFVPILSWIVFRKKTSLFTWIGTLLAVLGLYYLCMTETFTVAKADLIILSATVFFALHILLIGKFVHEFEGIHFSMVEFTAGGIMCLIYGFFAENLSFDMILSVIPSILYCGIGGIGICYALQVTAQKYTDATIAALLMSLESVFAAISGYIFLNERFSGREFVGIVLIIIAIVLAQLPPWDELKGKLERKKLEE